MTHGSDVREIAGISFGRSRKGILVAIRVYSDKAGEESCDGIITVGGYMADAGICEEIENDWKIATGDRVFHLTDFGTESCQLRSRDWSVEERREFLKRLASIVNRSEVTIFSSSLTEKDYYGAISRVEFPGEIGPMFSACAYDNLTFTERRLDMTGLFSQCVQYVFEKGDREHEITQVFRDIDKNDSRRSGMRGYGFQPKQTTLLQPADLIAGMIQRCVLKGRDSIPSKDDSISHHIDLFKLNDYYDSDGITQVLVAEHDRNSCRILTTRFIADLGAIASLVLSRLPSTLVHKRKKRYTYRPRKPNDDRI